MALVKCNNCGHMVSDMADVCPKCGAAVTQAPVETQPQPEAVSNNPNKPKRKGVIIACIVAVLLLIGGGAAWYFHGSDKASKNGNEHPVYSEELRKYQPAIDFLNQQRTGIVSSSRQKEKETVNFTGTYEFNDGFHTWVLVLNADESATIQEKEHQNDPDMTSYGSWSYYKYTQPDNLDLRFTDLAAKVWFKSSNNFVSLSYPVINIKDGFLYMDDNAAKAKNPNLRIKLTKTK